MVTDRTAYLEMLACIALAEAENDMGSPDAILSYLDKIGTEDLHKVLSAATNPVIESFIIGALATRADADGDELTRLATVRRNHRVQRDLCTAAVAVYLRTGKTPSKEVLKALNFASGTAVHELAARILIAIPKGELPQFLPDTAMCYYDRVMDEFARRNDPVGENLADMLTLPYLSQQDRIAILTTLRNDPRVTLDYLLTITNNKLAMSLVYDKAKEISTSGQITMYLHVPEDAQAAIVLSLGECEDLLYMSIELLMRYAKTANVQKGILRSFGMRLPIKRLLEIRQYAIDEEAGNAFKSIFQARTEDLLELLTSE